jgi:hypothetical protein
MQRARRVGGLETQHHRRAGEQKTSVGAFRGGVKGVMSDVSALLVFTRARFRQSVSQIAGGLCRMRFSLPFCCRTQHVHSCPLLTQMIQEGAENVS